MIVKKEEFIKSYVNKIIIPKLNTYLEDEDFEMKMVIKANQILKGIYK